TFVRNGTLAFTSAGALTNSTIRIGSSSGTGVDAGVNLVTAAGGVSLSTTFNPVTTSGSGNLTVNSQNTSGTNTLSGHFGLDRDFTITQSAGGTLNITQARANATDTVTGFDIKGFTTTLQADGSVNDSGTIYNSTGSGSIIKTGNGVLTLSSSNSYSGNTTVNAGTLKVSDINALGISTVSVNAATLEIGGIAISANNLTLNNGATLKGSGGGTSSYSKSSF